MNSDRIYLEQILTCIERIELYTEAGEHNFLHHIQIQDAVYRNFEVIGEKTKKISSGTKQKSPTTPWSDLADLREVLTDDVDPKEVWAIIETYLSDFKKAVRSLLTQLESNDISE